MFHYIFQSSNAEFKAQTKGTQRLFSVKYLFGEANIAYRIFHYLGPAKNFSITVPFMYKSPRFSEAEFVTFHSPSNAIFVEKRDLKLSDSKNVIERGIRKIFT